MNENLTRREIELIRILAGAKDFVSAGEICERMQIKSRTLRECVRGFRDYQEDTSGIRIESKPGFGYKMVITDRNKYYALQKELLESETKNQYLMPSDAAGRADYIIRRLLTRSDYEKADDLAERLYISRSTLAEDIRQVREKLDDYGLQLKTVTGKGIKVEGKEKSIRNAIADYCFQSAFDSRLLNVSVQQYFSTEEYTLVRDTLYETIRRYHFRMTDANFRNLVIHLLVACQRISDGTYIEEFEAGEYSELRHTREWKIAVDLYRQLMKDRFSQVPDSEISYAVIHLLGKHLIADESEMVWYPETLNLLNEVLQAVYQETGTDFRGDIELYSALALHLQPLLERAKYGLHAKNPLLQKIRSENSTAYEYAVLFTGEIERRRSVRIEEGEIGYLALHFSLAMERLKQETKKRILVICASGGGTSRILAYRLKKKFGETAETIDTMSYYDLQRNPDCGYDLVISTVPIYFEVPIPVVRINELPDEADFEKIDSVIKEETDSPLDLQKYFLPDLFCTGSYDTPQEIIHVLTEKLRTKTALPDDFEELVLEREKLSSTSLGNLVAFPHPARLVADETKAAVMVLSRETSWFGRPVRLVILSAMQKADSEEFRMYTKLTSSFVTDRARVSRVIADPQYKVMMACLRELAGSSVQEEEEDIFQ